MKILAITMLVGALSLSVNAESNTYFGIGVSQTTIKDSGVVNGVRIQTNYKEYSYKALIGKRINDNWSIEGQYVNFSKGNTNTKLNGVSSVADIFGSGSSIGVAGLYHFNPSEDFSPFVKLGYHSWDSKVVNTATNVSAKIDGTDEFYGVGVDGKINQTMKYRVEFERMKTVGADIDNIGVGLLFNF